jgi:hypothetical protein
MNNKKDYLVGQLPTYGELSPEIIKLAERYGL